MVGPLPIASENVETVQPLGWTGKGTRRGPVVASPSHAVEGSQWQVVNLGAVDEYHPAKPFLGFRLAECNHRGALRLGQHAPESLLYEAKIWAEKGELPALTPGTPPMEHDPETRIADHAHDKWDDQLVMHRQRRDQ